MLNKIWDWLFEPQPTHSPDIQRQFQRNIELQEARMRFLLEHHREPTHRELWNLSDPFKLEVT